MTYIDLINRFWKLNKEHSFTPCESILYLKLLDTCNSLGWKNPFNQSNKYICVETGIAERTLIDARNRLKQLGLINFTSGKKRRVATIYSIVGLPENPTFYSKTCSTTCSETSSKSDSKKGENSSDNNRDRKEKDQDKDLFGDESPLSAGADGKVPVQKIIDEYNRLCLKLPKATSKSDARSKAVRARMKEHGAAVVLKMLKLVSESDYLGGKNKDNWVASFDWLFKPNNFVKIIEGNYANKSPSETGTIHFNNKPSPLQLIEEAYENLVNNGTIPG